MAGLWEIKLNPTHTDELITADDTNALDHYCSPESPVLLRIGM